MKLWDYVDGEPFMINSAPAFFGHPRKKRKSPQRKKSMKYKTNRRRRRVYRRRSNPGTRAAAVMRAHNPRRRRRSYRRRSYRHNPSVHYALKNRRHRRRRNPPTFAGLKLTEILYTGGAVIVAPLLENQIRPLLPTSLQSGTAGRWALKVGTAAITWQAWKYIFGSRIGELTAVVLGSNLLSDAVAEFAPSLTSGLGGYRPLAPRRGLAGYLNVPTARGSSFVGRPALMPARGPLDPVY